MTGNLYRGQAGLPFSSPLRVYEPLDAKVARDLRATVYGWLALTFEMCRQRLKDPSIDAGFVADSCAHALLNTVGRVPGLPSELVRAAAPESR